MASTPRLSVCLFASFLTVMINTEASMWLTENEISNMNRQEIKAPYTAPIIEMLQIPQSLNLLVSVSVEAGIEDWEEGEEL